jgi:nitrite reductase/ring-hydroxylating ferredoxin subunit/uncharacterized membrane protein
MRVLPGDIDHALVATIERQEWLAPIEETVQKNVARVMSAAGRHVRNFLNGTWLGHPLHPALTDVPVGAWTIATCFDAFDGLEGGQRYARASERAIAIGIGGAVLAAAAGAADWQHTSGGSRRTGFVHAIANTTALGLFVGSLALRRRGDRDRGEALSALGYLVMLGASYLGGALVCRDRIGVDHSAAPLEPTREITLDVQSLAEGERRRIDVDGVPVMLVRDGGRVFALAAQCSHLGGPLDEGTIENGVVQCPWHASRFCLADGRVIDGPATIPQPCYEVREVGGRFAVHRAA